MRPIVSKRIAWRWMCSEWMSGVGDDHGGRKMTIAKDDTDEDDMNSNTMNEMKQIEKYKRSNDLKEKTLGDKLAHVMSITLT